MTVLVLDSPELIARAAALEATQADREVQAVQAKIVQPEDVPVAKSCPALTPDGGTSSRRRSEELALVG